jgi:hypothetical protein
MPITALSPTFSLCFTDETWSTTFEPAGITAPFEPVTASCTVAVKRSPGLWVFVQMRSPDASVSVVPAAIEAMRPSLPAGVRVSVFPDAVVRGVVDVGVVGRVDGRDVEGREVLGRGAEVVGAGVVGVFAGTSVSCGCAAES